MPPGPGLGLPGYILPHHQVIGTSTVSPPVLIFTARIDIKRSLETTSNPTAVQTSTSSPTSIPPYPASVDWTPSVKFGLFLVGAFVCLILCFVTLTIIRKIRDRSQRTSEQRIREVEDRRRDAALQWQCLELERHVEDARAWEMLMHQRITTPATYTEQVEEAEFPRFCTTPLTTGDFVEARDTSHCRDGNLPESSQVATKNEGIREKTEEFNKARETNIIAAEGEAVISEESETHGQKPSAIEPSSGSSIGETVELNGSSSIPLSSDEVLRAVNALGYESISGTQRAQARARALKDLEGR